MLTAGQDWDILLHRLSNGVRIGQFAQDDLWNIYDMSPYEKIRPNYVREWLQEKKRNWVNMITDRMLEAKRKGLITEEESKVPVRLSTKDQLRAMGINLGINMDDLDGSFGENGSAGGNNDDFDMNALESEEEDLKEQDQFKGINLM